MRGPIAAVLCAFLLVSACGEEGQEKTSAEADPAPVVAQVASAPAPETTPKCTAYRDDLSGSDMVRLFYDTAGLSPPFEKWTVALVRNPDRNISQEEAWQRAASRVAAEWDAVRGVRCVVIRAYADVRSYDDARGGLEIGAFRPGSHFTFGDATGESVRVRLRNSDAAHFWTMPRERANALKANSGLWDASAFIRIRIVSARPSGREGVIEAEIDDYDIAARPGGYLGDFRETIVLK